MRTKNKQRSEGTAGGPFNSSVNIWSLTIDWSVNHFYITSASTDGKHLTQSMTLQIKTYNTVIVVKQTEPDGDKYSYWPDFTVSSGIEQTSLCVYLKNHNCAVNSFPLCILYCM